MATLYIVPTPLGNLKDITLRALEVLKAVDIIACEDTRHTRILLDHYGISGHLVSSHQHSSEKSLKVLLDALRAGKSVALVSDAGTPGISDPGVKLVQAAVDANIPVVPLPGPSAFVTALSASGAHTHEFLFLGFLPHKKGRVTLFRKIAASDATVVFYESPHRILKALQSLAEILPMEKKVVVARELTKIHEEFLRGSAAEILESLRSREKVLGEFVVIVSHA